MPLPGAAHFMAPPPAAAAFVPGSQQPFGTPPTELHPAVLKHPAALKQQPPQASASSGRPAPPPSVPIAVPLPAPVPAAQPPAEQAGSLGAPVSPPRPLMVFGRSQAEVGQA